MFNQWYSMKKFPKHPRLNTQWKEWKVRPNFPNYLQILICINRRFALSSCKYKYQQAGLLISVRYICNTPDGEHGKQAL